MQNALNASIWRLAFKTAKNWNWTATTAVEIWIERSCLVSIFFWHVNFQNLCNRFSNQAPQVVDLQIILILIQASSALQCCVHPDDAKVLSALRGLDVAGEAQELINQLERRHGKGFWQPGMERLSDDEYMARLVAWGREFALKSAGKPWRAHIYKHYKLQVAYIQEYFETRTDVVKEELCQLRNLAGLRNQNSESLEEQSLTPWQTFFQQIQRMTMGCVNMGNDLSRMNTPVITYNNVWIYHRMVCSDSCIISSYYFIIRLRWWRRQCLWLFVKLGLFWGNCWKRSKHVRIVDLAGGPGCCAAGACQFFSMCFETCHLYFHGFDTEQKGMQGPH